MLYGIDPVLTGALLHALDDMGHGDGVVVTDAHFPAATHAHNPVISLPSLTVPRVLAAIRTVLTPDEYRPWQLGVMATPTWELADVHREIIAAARLGSDATLTDTAPVEPSDGSVALLIQRLDFYPIAAQSRLIVRTGEIRPYACAVFFKGVTPPGEHDTLS